MKAILCLFIVTCLTSTVANAQMQNYKGKTFIFDGYSPIIKSNALGVTEKNPEHAIAPRGALFIVESVSDSGGLVISFLEWKLPKDTVMSSSEGAKSKYRTAVANRAQFNYKTEVGTNNLKEKLPDSQIIFFLLSKNNFDKFCVEYKQEQKWDVTFGAMTTPFKLRTSPFNFSTNLNLGTAVCYQRKFRKDFSWGIIAGVSLTQVVLDSFSTKGYVATSSERPAITPSVHGMIGYKNINVTLGFGWDIINRTSTIEESWRYHGNTWIGIGIGISLFNANKGSTTDTQPVNN